jgi:GrpB-like predicted nucleotidyltransferase (UPF0157 family)
MIEILSYDPEWPERFARLGSELRGALGGVALRNRPHRLHCGSQPCRQFREQSVASG